MNENKATWKLVLIPAEIRNSWTVQVAIITVLTTTEHLNHTDVMSVLGLLHLMFMSDVADVSKVHAASIFRVKVDFDPEDGGSMYL
jgi:hypothetical protein